MDNKKRVLVTGASGFLGGRVIEAMHLSGFAQPIGTIRRWSRATRPARFPTTLLLCDILDPQQVARAVVDVDAVVHCAYTNDRHSIVEGTRQLLDAASRAHVPRFVFLSSAEVYGAKVQGIVDESSPLVDEGSEYALAKRDAEQLVMQANTEQFGTTVLRPSLIYGPFGTSWTIDLAKRLMSGKWGEFEGFGSGTANLVYVDDLVRAIFHVLSTEASRGNVYNVNGPDRVTWNEYFRRFNATLERDPLPQVSSASSQRWTAVMDRVDRLAGLILDRFEEPLMKIYLRGGFLSRCMKGIKNALNATPTVHELHNLYNRDAYYTDARIREQLDFAPAVELDEGLRLTVAWLRHQGIVAGGTTAPTMLSPIQTPNEAASVS
ncbi:MAG: NAD(P)-dependent oxidoreductase [Planctomycetales bacterium]|nr:NAD(P)-dependent oxidoreductase [Planctomycetales bacterium]